MNVYLGLLKANVSLGRGGEVPESIPGGFQKLYDGVCKVIFMANPTSVEVELCCVVVGVVTIVKF